MSQHQHLVLRPEFRSSVQGTQQQKQQGEPAPFVSHDQASEEPQPAPTEQGAPARPQVDQTQQCYSTLPWLLAMIAVFYFLLIRPQQKQEKARRAMLGAIKVGDKVVTSGGIHGTISTMSEDTITLRVDPKLKLTIDRQNIARVLNGEQPKGAKS